MIVELPRLRVFLLVAHALRNAKILVSWFTVVPEEIWDVFTKNILVVAVVVSLNPNPSWSASPDARKARDKHCFFVARNGRERRVVATVDVCCAAGIDCPNLIDPVGFGFEQSLVVAFSLW